MPGAEVTRSAPDAGGGDEGDGDGSGSGGRDATGLLILIILFGYIAIAVANSLITAALARRAEFAPLETVGATPRQRRATLRWQAVFLAATACITGTALALPGLIAMTYALSDGNRLVPAIDPIAYAGILVFTFLLILGATASAGRAIVRDRPGRTRSRGGARPGREGRHDLRQPRIFSSRR